MLTDMTAGHLYGPQIPGMTVNIKANTVSRFVNLLLPNKTIIRYVHIVLDMDIDLDTVKV